MRRKKQQTPQPSNLEPQPAPSEGLGIDPATDKSQAIQVLEQMLLKILPPRDGSSVSVTMLRAMSEMMGTLCFLRGVKAEYWCEVMDRIASLNYHAGCLLSEVNHLHTLELPESSKVALDGAAKLSADEINQLRDWLAQRLLELQQMPLPTVKLN